MKNNYYDIKRRNRRKQSKIKKQLQKNSRMPKISRLTPEEKKQSNYRKRKAKKLNYKKVFLALIIFVLLIYLFFSGIAKLFSKPKKAESVEAVVPPKDVTINMAVVRRYNVPFNKF